MRRERRRTLLACALLLVFAAGVRCYRAPLVFSPEGVLAIDGDSYYHFRRIAWTAHNFPALLRFDPYVNFPRGGEPIWSPPFDFLLGALVRATVGSADPAAMERMLAFVPAAIGALHAALLFLLGRRFLPPAAAFAAGLLLAVLPAHFVYSQVGFVDHHVAVSLAGSLLLFAAMAFAARPGRREAGVLALAMAGALLLWPGCLIHVAVAQALLLTYALGVAERSRAASVARRLAGAHALAALAVAPLCVGHTWIRWGSVSPLVLSNFQPLWLGAGAACFGILGEGWRRLGWPRTLLGRLGAAAAVGIAVAAALSAALPELGTSGAADAWAWLARKEEFQSVVSESQPLLWKDGGLDLAIGAKLFSGSFFLAPLALAAVLWHAHRRRRPDLAVLAGWSAAFLAFALGQARFVVDLAPALALLLAAAVHAALVEWTPPEWRRLLALAAAAAGLLLCAPLVGWYLDRSPAAARGQVRRMALSVATGHWLGAHSPPTSGFDEPGPPPEYGVLGPWGAGHVIRYAARRPVVQDNFGDDVGQEGFAAAEAYFSAESEFAGLALLESLRVRYVLVGPTGSGHGHGYARDSLFARLRRRDGGPVEGGGASQLQASSLTRHRLVYESEPIQPGSGPPQWKLFEVVAGARVAGRAEPGAPVEATLPLETGRGRRFGFVVRRQADAEGRYELTVPYASGARDEVISAPRYRLKSGALVAELAVTEDQVQRGDTVPGPDLRARPGGGEGGENGHD
jgi:dolichyl-phosphooligosaccharide-protein glycotransferase